MKNIYYSIILLVLILTYSCEKNPAALEILGNYKISFIRCCHNIWIMNNDGSDKYRLLPNDEFHQFQQWSPDGTKIGFSSNRDGNFEIYVIDINGDNLTRLTNHPGYHSYSFCWSPNGKEIYYTSEEDGNSEIYKMSIKRTNKKRLTFNTHKDLNPTWSFPGNKLLFTSDLNGSPGNREIFSINQEGTDLKQITINAGIYCTQFSCSPTDNRVVYCSKKNGKKQLYIIDLDGKNEKQLTNTQYRSEYPSWSPDGKKIIFLNYIDERQEIYTVDPDGKNIQRLTNNDYGNGSPDWSPDSRFIAFRSYRNSQIYIMDSDGSNQRQITFPDHSNDWCANPKWCPIVTY